MHTLILFAEYSTTENSAVEDIFCKIKETEDPGALFPLLFSNQIGQAS